MEDKQSSSMETSNAQAKSHALSVGDLVSYLKSHFKPEAGLCWIDCIEGVRYNVRPMTEGMLGKKFFSTVGNVKKEHISRGVSRETVDKEFFPYVCDDDILIN